MPRAGGPGPGARDERALADPGLALQEHHGPVARAGPGERAADALQLVLTLEQLRRHSSGL